MKDDHPDREHGAQEISTGEREAKTQEEQQENVGKGPTEGRDVPPEDVNKPRRDPKSPWLGGG